MRFNIVGASGMMISTPTHPPSAMASRLKSMHLAGQRIRVVEVTAEIRAERPWSARWWRKVAKLEKENSTLLYMEVDHGP